MCRSFFTPRSDTHRLGKLLGSHPADNITGCGSVCCDIYSRLIFLRLANGRKRTGSSIRDQRVDFIDFLKPGRQGSLPKKRGLHLLGTILYVSVRDWPPPGKLFASCIVE